MWTMMIPVVAAALLAQPADPVTVAGVVVDPAGKPVSDVEVVLSARRLTDGSIPTLARSMTDDRGAFRLEVAREPLTGIGPRRWIWAYRPGRSLAVQEAILTGKGPLPPVRMTLAEPLRRTLTILGPDDRPLAAVRLVPVLFAINDRAMFLTPDDWLDRLTVATGTDGVATIPYLPATIDPLLLRVTAPGFVPHKLPLRPRPGSDRFTLKLGRPARLTGSVYDDSGQPAANVSVEVWAENAYITPRDPDGTRKPRLHPSLIHFDSGPVRTRADGSFLTPPQLMTGSSYQIIIRPEGDPLVSFRLAAGDHRADDRSAASTSAAPQTGRAGPRSPR